MTLVYASSGESFQLVYANTALFVVKISRIAASSLIPLTATVVLTRKVSEYVGYGLFLLCDFFG